MQSPEHSVCQARNSSPRYSESNVEVGDRWFCCPGLRDNGGASSFPNHTCQFPNAAVLSVDIPFVFPNDFGCSMGGSKFIPQKHILLT